MSNHQLLLQGDTSQLLFNTPLKTFDRDVARNARNIIMHKPVTNDIHPENSNNEGFLTAFSKDGERTSVRHKLRPNPLCSRSF
jgi:hypothetical protein